MDKLRHISIAVPDVAATAAFYEKTFGLERVKEGERSIMLSDGTVNLTLTPPMDLESTEHRNFVGIHHLGFVVEDKQQAQARMVENGGQSAEGKTRDPNKIIVNVQTKYWVGSK